MKKGTLVKAAKELNKVLGLDPQIEVKEIEKEELQIRILEAAALLVPEDEITNVTREVIDTLTEMNAAPAEDIPLDPAEEDSSEPATNPINSEKKKSKKTKAAKEDSPVKEIKITKKSVIEDCLKEGATIEQMAQKITDLGIDPDYEKNCKIVKLWLSKMGYDVKKAAITADPIFRSK